MNDNDDNASKCTDPGEALEKILAADMSEDNSSEPNKMGGEAEMSGDNARQSPKTSDKLASMENADGSRSFGLQRPESKNLPNDSNLLISDLANDNHSNISDSDDGDFPDDVDDSSNDSAKSGNSHGFLRLVNKSNDVPSKMDEASTKSDQKVDEQLPYSMNFLDDLNTSDTTDSNSSEKEMKYSNVFNLIRDCAKDAPTSDGAVKSSPGAKKSVSSCIGLSMDSAIGSKSVDDDNAMSDLHTDNISDDEYDIKPDSLSARKSDNISIRNNETFDSIANYISPVPISLNTLISADYSNLSDNNDTNSNDNRDDGKRSDSSPSLIKPEPSESSRITDKDIMEPGELLGANLLECQDSNASEGDNMKSDFSPDHKDKSNGAANADASDADTGKKGDLFSTVDAAASKADFSSLLGKNDGDSADTTKTAASSQDNRKQGDSTQKTDDEIFSLNFLDDHSMQDSNQSGLLGNYCISTRICWLTFLILLSSVVEK